MFRLAFIYACVMAAVADDVELSNDQPNTQSLYPACDSIQRDVPENFVQLHEAPQPPHGVSKNHYLGGQFAMFENTVTSGGATIYYFQNAQNRLSRVGLFQPTTLADPFNLPVGEHQGSSWFPGYEVAELFCTSAADDVTVVHHLGLVFYNQVALLQKQGLEAVTAAELFYAFPATYTRKDARISEADSNKDRSLQLELRVDESWMGIDPSIANPPGLYAIDFAVSSDPADVAESQLVQLGTKIGLLIAAEM